MLLRPLGARGQQTRWCRGPCAPGGARGLIDLGAGGGDSLCVQYATKMINISEKTVKQKKFPSLFSASRNLVALGQVVGKLPFHKMFS